EGSRRWLAAGLADLLERLLADVSQDLAGVGVEAVDGLPLFARLGTLDDLLCVGLGDFVGEGIDQRGVVVVLLIGHAHVLITSTASVVSCSGSFEISLARRSRAWSYCLGRIPRCSATCWRF